MAEYVLYVGDVDSPMLVFTDASLLSVSGTSAVDLVGDELSIDQFTPVCRYTWYAKKALQPTDSSIDALISSDGLVLYGFYNLDPSSIPFGTPVWYYRDGVPEGKFYIESVRRIGKISWQINAMSIVGVLEVQYHRGGVYTGSTFAELLVELVGGTISSADESMTLVSGGLVDCFIENAVAVTTVHGLLPYDTKRNNLHKLLFAYVVNMTTSTDGSLVFSYLKTSNSPELIPRNRIYAEGSVAYEQPVTTVELTEYTYIFDESAEPEQVYDNTTAAHVEGEAFIQFSKPINPDTISTSNGTITVRDANETGAFVSGHGIISAVPYQIQSRILTREVENYVVQKTVSVTDVTLVNPLNSSNIMARLFEYYTHRTVVSSTLIKENEKAGELYQFYTPYDELTSGIIQRMSWSTSGLTKAQCEIVTNYEPLGVSTNMQNLVLLTGSGRWEVPSAVRQSANPFIRAVIIQGGQGGHGGYSGQDSQRRPDSPGAGGASGEGGSGGKVLTVDIDVSSLDYIDYACGNGGEGGESDSPGAYGEETTFGDYSSYYGAVVPGGILNLINGKFYARSGSKGIAGASGGLGASSAANWPTGAELAGYGGNGEDLTVKDKTWTGGKGGRANNAAQGGYTGWAFGGGGGGAAYGANGKNGGDGHVEWQAVIGGRGGEGATAAIPGSDARHTGNGGDGGHGGGGAGAPGSSGWSAGSSPVGYVGVGGKGSKGGQGAPGGILIYY